MGHASTVKAKRDREELVDVHERVRPAAISAGM
jgi:hypothetical protein